MSTTQQGVDPADIRPGRWADIAGEGGTHVSGPITSMSTRNIHELTGVSVAGIAGSFDIEQGWRITVRDAYLEPERNARQSRRDQVRDLVGGLVWNIETPDEDLEAVTDRVLALFDAAARPAAPTAPATPGVGVGSFAPVPGAQIGAGEVGLGDALRELVGVFDEKHLPNNAQHLERLADRADALEFRVMAAESVARGTMRFARRANEAEAVIGRIEVLAESEHAHGDAITRCNLVAQRIRDAIDGPRPETNGTKEA